MKRAGLFRVEGRAVAPTASLWLAVAAAALSGACGGSAPRTDDLARVDTLPSGRVLVSNADSGIHGANGLRLVEELRIGSVGGDGPDVFGDVVSLAVDRNGVVYVADRGAEEVLVFDRTGSFLRRLARQGDGPGEFSWTGPVGIAWQPPGRLWVVDMPELALLDTAGAPLGKAFRGLDFADVTPHTDTSGFAYVQRIDIRVGAEAMAHEGLASTPVAYYVDKYALSREEEVATVGRLHLGDWTWMDKIVDHGGRIRERRTLPLQPDLVWTAAPGGTVWAADKSQYRLHELTFAGDTVRTVELRRDRAPLQSPERDSVAEHHGFEPGDLPPYRLAMDRVDAGPDGFLWVRNTLPDGGYTWDVFDPCGRYLGPVVPEARLDGSPVVVAEGGVLFGVAKDDMDLEFVVRLALRSRDGSPVAATGADCTL